MIVYICMFIISILFTYLSTKAKNKIYKIIFQILATLPFVVVSAIRYDVGTDYFFRYVPNYNVFVNNGTVDSLEPLFIILIRICIFFSKDYVALFIATSIIINVLIMFTIFKYSKNPVISVIIYFCASFYFQSMNLVRQFIAMAILLIGYRIILLDNKKKYLYIIFVLIATLFHSMSAVFLLLLFTEKKEIKFKHCMIIIALILLLGGYIGHVVDFIVTNTPLNEITNIAKYVKYFKTGGDLSIAAIAVEVAVYIYIYCMFDKIKEKNSVVDKEAIFFMNMQTLALICMVMNVHFELFFRIALVFSIFQIISIPYFWFKNKNEDFSIFKFKIKSGATVFTVLILCVMSARMLYSNVLKGAEEILPYKTVFDEERKLG